MSISPSLEKTDKKTIDPRAIGPRILRGILLIALDMFVLWFSIKLINLGYYTLFAAILVIALVVNFVVIRKEAYPFRWMLIGLVLMGLFTIYPIIFTIWVAFTNYGEGHLITKEQAVDQITNIKYLPESGKSYKWTAFKSPEGDYALWLIDPESNSFLVKVGEPLVQGITARKWYWRTG